MLRNLLKYKSILIMCVCSIAAYTLFGQKHDYNYLSRPSLHFGGIMLKFDDSIDSLIGSQYNVDHTMSACPSFSDKNGELLFYSNNRNLYNKEGKVIDNGYDIAVGAFLPYLNSIVSDQTFAIGKNFVTVPLSDSIFYAIHKGVEISAYEFYDLDVYENGEQLGIYSDGLYLTVIRLAPDGSLYINEDEKKTLIVDEKFEHNQIVVCKHANGKDWWIHQPMVETPDAYLLRLNSDGTLINHGRRYFSEHNGRLRSYSVYKTNPAGNILARIIGTFRQGMHKLELFHFDRCTGSTERFFVDSLEMAEINTRGIGIEFSQSGRFLYIANSQNILQLDLDDEEYFENRDTIAVWDNFVQNGQPTLFEDLWRLPNGKIVVNSGFRLPYLHYIHNPDQKGVACNFESRSYISPVDPLSPGSHLDISFSPNFPEYRMEALDVDCITGTATVAINDIIDAIIYPNPVLDILNIDFRGTIEKVDIQVVSASGIVMNRYYSVSSSLSFSTHDYPSGIYIVIVTSVADDKQFSDRFIKM